MHSVLSKSLFVPKNIFKQFFRGGCGPHIIGLSEVLIDYTAVKSNGTSTKLLWSGYGSNCNDTSPLETSEN